MGSLEGLTGKFRVSGSHAPKVQKKARPALACLSCRRNKSRCDKQQPCEACVRRSEADRCVYGTPTAGSARQELAEERLNHLESLVTSLLQYKAQSSLDNHDNGPSISDNSNDSPQALSDTSTAAQEGYVGSTHWSAMLDDILELKAIISSESEAPATNGLDGRESQHGEVLYGLPHSYNLQDIIQHYLPPQAEVDSLLSIYFSGETFILPILHCTAFRRQCQQFWSQSKTSNALWVSLLFSVCYMASKIAAATNHSPAINVERLHTAAGQCLVQGQYNLSQPYVPEALVLYAQSKNFHSLDPSREAAAILGMAIRHAYQMGYHRDPDIFGNLSIFEGEMRRRFWAVSKQMDLMLSFQLGLPSHIRLENSDAQSPRNLLDSDFDEDALQLPPARSDQEPTRLLWFIIKDKQMITFSKVCQDSLSFQSKTPEEVLQLDHEVRQMYASVPSVLRARPFADSMAESPFLIMTRIYIEFIYLKSLCVLHRRYMRLGDSYSTSAGTEAARSLVTRCLDMWNQLEPGGQLQNHQWMINCFTVNDFLLGVSTLCLAAHQKRGQPELQSLALTDTSSTDIFDLLRQSLTICDEKLTASRDATRLAKAVRLLVADADARAHSNPMQTQQKQQQYHPSPTLPTTTDQQPDQLLGTVDFSLFDPFDFINAPMIEDEWQFLDTSEPMLH